MQNINLNDLTEETILFGNLRKMVMCYYYITTRYYIRYATLGCLKNIKTRYI